MHPHSPPPRTSPVRSSTPRAGGRRTTLLALAGLLVVALLTVLVVRLARELTFPVIPASVPPAADSGTVVRTVDGDTIHVRMDAGGREVTVRLVGVDTPETHKPNWPVECWGPEAERWMRERAEGRRVTLVRDPVGDDMDRYGRLVRYVTLAGEPDSLNLQLVRTGSARAYTSYPFTQAQDFLAAQAQARAAQRGLWGAPCDGQRTQR